jgi:hypothetical protein
MSLPATHEELLAELDKLAAEAPTEAADIAGELAALMIEFRDARETERPGGGR